MKKHKVAKSVLEVLTTQVEPRFGEWIRAYAQRREVSMSSDEILALRLALAIVLHNKQWRKWLPDIQILGTAIVAVRRFRQKGRKQQKWLAKWLVGDRGSTLSHSAYTLAWMNTRLMLNIVDKSEITEEVHQELVTHINLVRQSRQATR